MNGYTIYHPLHVHCSGLPKFDYVDDYLNTIQSGQVLLPESQLNYGLFPKKKNEKPVAYLKNSDGEEEDKNWYVALFNRSDKYEYIKREDMDDYFIWDDKLMPFQYKKGMYELYVTIYDGKVREVASIKEYCDKNNLCYSESKFQKNYYIPDVYTGGNLTESDKKQCLIGLSSQYRYVTEVYDISMLANKKGVTYFKPREVKHPYYLDKNLIAHRTSYGFDNLPLLKSYVNKSSFSGYAFKDYRLSKVYNLETIMKRNKWTFIPEEEYKRGSKIDYFTTNDLVKYPKMFNLTEHMEIRRIMKKNKDIVPVYQFKYPLVEAYGLFKNKKEGFVYLTSEFKNIFIFKETINKIGFKINDLTIAGVNDQGEIVFSVEEEQWYSLKGKYKSLNNGNKNIINFVL